ncbi:MAG: response regulator, partial [Bacteroidales bacterium]|nr:response regulator [Bacteroidales bacterium]
SLSKLESGKMKLQAQEVNIVSLVNRYVQSFESLAKQKKIEFKFNSSGTNTPLFVDKDKMEKILYNLLSNAFKFTGEGGRIEVTVGSLQFANNSKQTSTEIAYCKLPTANLNGPWVEIIVSNTGHGIHPDQLPHIFNRFYQADDNYTKDQEGTGIGLALTKELVELHHGKISVESELNKETTFTVFLPMGKEHLKEEELVESDVRKDSYGESESWEAIPDQFIEIQDQETTIIDNALEGDSKPLILIVEDNDDLRSYVRSYLTDDYLISEAIDGEMGLNKAIDKIPDLIVSDVMMPKMDGIEFTRKIKADERTSHIPVILLTAKAAREDKLEGLETGADDFLTKPFDPDELLVRIRNLIQQRRKWKEIILKNIGSVNQLSSSGITSMDQKFLKKAVVVVEKHISDSEFSVELFGKEMAMSRVQLHRKLTALVEQSASEFIRTIRLNKAAIFLKEKSGNIAEIAYGVGFSNPSYFSECFRKQFGKLPSEYSD